MSLADQLAVQERAWNERPLVRSLYREWFETIARRLAPAGPTVELGAGIARFREVASEAIATDVEPTPWVDEVVDAEHLPYRDGSIANLVLIDVFHHLPSPTDFLAEAVRVLRPGGRVLILDPYCSPVSTVAYKAGHHERTDLAAPPFGDDELARGRPLEGNQARATLVFFRHADEYAHRYPELPVIETKRLALVEYPLSGGFTKRPLLGRRMRTVERALSPLASLLAFRCLVVLERRGTVSPSAARTIDGPVRAEPSPGGRRAKGVVRRVCHPAVLGAALLLGACAHTEHDTAERTDLPDSMPIVRAMHDDSARDRMLDTMPGGEMARGDSAASMRLLKKKM